MTASIEEQFEERLKKLSADFEFFAHVTSHDLRDPLRQARIYLNETLEKAPEEFKKKISASNNLIDEVLEKIAILREFSYIANDKSELSAVDLNKNIQEIIADFSGINPENIEISDLPSVNGIEQHLRRVFSVLIDNAIQFKSPDRKLHIKINAVEEGDLWHFTVEDNGIGLEEVYRELVFVLFQKLDTEPGNPHYGAGLAFAKKIVENHGGTIWYKSDGESGTAFHFTLPK